MESWLWQGFVNTEEKYSVVEYTDIHFMYGKANGNAVEAARLYAEAFLTESIPTVELSPQSPNALGKMCPSDTKNDQVDRKP